MKNLLLKCKDKKVKAFTLLEIRVSKSVVFYFKFSNLYQ